MAWKELRLLIALSENAACLKNIVGKTRSRSFETCEKFSILNVSTMIFIFTFPENEDSISFYLVLVVS